MKDGTRPSAAAGAPDTGCRDQGGQIEIAIFDQRDVDKQAGSEYINDCEHIFRTCVEQGRKTCAGCGGLGCVRGIVPCSLARLYFFWQKIMKQRRGWREDQCGRLHTVPVEKLGHVGLVHIIHATLTEFRENDIA